MYRSLNSSDHKRDLSFGTPPEKKRKASYAKEGISGNDQITSFHCKSYHRLVSYSAMGWRN